MSSSLISTLHVLYLRLLCVLYVFHTCFIRVSNSWPLSGCTVILILAESALSLASSRELHTWCHELNNNISCKQHKKRTWNPQNTRKHRVLVPGCYKRYDTTLQTQSTIVKFPKAKEIRTAAGRGTRDVSSHIFPGLKYPVLTEWQTSFVLLYVLLEVDCSVLIIEEAFGDIRISMIIKYVWSVCWIKWCKNIYT